MKILFLESDQFQEYNCSGWRCVVPHRAMAKAGHQSRVIRLEEWAARTPNATKLSEEADIIFVQRNLFHDVVPIVFYWRAKGKTVVVDLDDSYENMSEETGSPSYKFWRKGIVDQPQPDGSTKEAHVVPMPLDLLKYGVKLCAGLTSPSKLICKDWERFIRTYWFPNYVDLSVYRQYPTYREPGTISLGWGGSMTHLISWTNSGAAQAVTQIINENPRVKIVLLGDPRTERFFDGVQKRNRLHAGWVPQSIFASKLSAVDIGLIPLFGEYDRRRSWIKTAEYSVMGIPWIGTDMEPTQEINTGQRVQNTAEDWYNAIKFYVDNYPDLKATADANVEMAQQFFGIDYHTDDLTKLFERIISEDK